ncbi:Type 4 prepilin-like proteins leader peptide-processing enzyme [Saezia sanguinis]|uniref:Prepilin leader peptidase/N-methyltransferase n=1 Tax=Saezia sanguinis TaxID=1965230 RepID=A0A433SC01_9BURK|nr:Type 4 prepilin-like proteins leader peptide-processing enzyme [Saezia sanguinis]
MIEALIALPTGAFVALVVILGLLIGSFLNVVIYRLPKMIERDQDEAIAEVIEQKITGNADLDFLPLLSTCPNCQHTFRWSQGIAVSATETAPKKSFSLTYPPSACPHCGHKIRWWENIPVISWLFLRGRCSSCKARISFRYPLIELLTGILFGVVAWHYGATIQTILWCFFVAMNIAIAMIDWDTTWLPDSLSLTLMWAGLLAALIGWSIPVAGAMWGAVFGYMILWIVATLFKLLTGRIAMANGDFKMLAALGAWFGWEFLLPILLASSLVGAIIGLTLKAIQSKTGLFEGKYIPYGPFLAGAGLLILICSPSRIQAWFPFLFF